MRNPLKSKNLCFIFHCIPCALPRAGLGKHRTAPSIKVSFQRSTTEAEPLLYTPASYPWLHVVQANLHLSISESSAFSYSFCFPVKLEITTCSEESFRKLGLACQLPHWVLQIFLLPLSTSMGGREFGSNSDPGTSLWGDLSKYKSKLLKCSKGPLRMCLGLSLSICQIQGWF